jgi:hypothetical protein
MCNSQESPEFPDSDFGLLNYGKFFLFLEESGPVQAICKIGSLVPARIPSPN